MSAESETLAWEAERRSRAGSATVAGGVLLLASNVVLATVFRDLPATGYVDALREGIAGREGLVAPKVAYVDDRAVPIVLQALALALGMAGIALGLLFLLRAARARRAETPGAARFLLVGGAAAMALGWLLFWIGRVVSAAGFSGTTDQAARDALNPPVALAGGAIHFVGAATLGLGIILTALNAMRAGLLTRFMGVLGIIAGGLFVLQQFDNLSIVRSFWLIALGVLVLGRWPNGVPAAWRTGRAEPWPTQQELRERREALRAEHAVEAETESPAAEPAGAESVGRRKRKRRR